tara:strand:- start:7310 stop:8539 length:1230 start_codon:yes stop_codon:yes gene_type:complete
VIRYLNRKNFIIFLILSTILKIVFSIFYGDKVFDNEWGKLYYNLINFSSLSYNDVYGEKVPSVYMPPLYIYFLYIFSFFNFSELLTIQIVKFVQCLISCISVYYFYKISKNFFEQKISLIIAILYCFYPLNFYAPSQISSITLQLFLFLGFLNFFINFEKKNNFIYFALFSGFSILIRGEFWLLFILCILFFFLKYKTKLIKKIILSLLMVSIIVTPYLIRNFINFNEIILTKSSGYNLWRGNSLQPKVSGELTNSPTIENEIIKIKNNLLKINKLNYYEVYIDNYYFDVAKENIIANPLVYIFHYFKKFIAYSIYNPFQKYEGYFNPIIYIPEIIISILALLGLSKNIFSKKRYTRIILVLIFYLLLIPVFFILPRYKLFILPMYFIFASYFIINLFSKKNFFQKAIK